MSQRRSVFSPHFEHQDVKCRTNGKSPMSVRYLCKVALMRRLIKEYAFPKSWFPGEPQPSSLESTFQQCFSSGTYRRVLCRLGMWTARLSPLCMCCHIYCSETMPRRICYLFEILKRSLRLPARSQSWLTSFWVFFCFSLSKSFPFSVFWRGPARLHGGSPSSVLGSAACPEAVWENSCSLLLETESGMNAAVVHRGCVQPLPKCESTA